jgi:EAL domain-containing protein (putative c-di-GMP-specific phosphodiesterase class I)
VVERVRRVLDGRGLSIAYQPIVDLRCGGALGFEALARFACPPAGPDVWFADAAGVGLDAELEALAIETALDALPWMPGGAYLSVNASPSMVVSGRLKALLSGVALDRVMLEITEHAPIPGYQVLAAALRPLRADGLRLAVDDAGAGYASLRHILNLRPDVIKLDITITRDIDKDEGRQALASALRTFAGDTGSTVVAEGVETEAELGALRDLDMAAAQGYHLGRPGPLPIRRDPLCSPSRGPERSWGRSPHGQRSLSALTA